MSETAPHPSSDVRRYRLGRTGPPAQFGLELSSAYVRDFMPDLNARDKAVLMALVYDQDRWWNGVGVMEMDVLVVAMRAKVSIAVADRSLLKLVSLDYLTAVVS